MDTTPPFRDPSARGRAFERVYAQLRALAARMQARDPSQSLQPTELVHEAAVRLLRAERVHWESEAHFRAIAARAMRQVLMDRARRREADRRGGGWSRLTLTGLGADDPIFDVVSLNQVLGELEELDPRRSEVAVLKVFGGLEEGEIASILGVSARTVRRDWRTARAWLVARLAAEPGQGASASSSG